MHLCCTVAAGRGMPHHTCCRCDSQRMDAVSATACCCGSHAHAAPVLSMCAAMHYQQQLLLQLTPAQHKLIRTTRTGMYALQDAHQPHLLLVLLQPSSHQKQARRRERQVPAQRAFGHGRGNRDNSNSRVRMALEGVWGEHNRQAAWESMGD